MRSLIHIALLLTVCFSSVAYAQTHAGEVHGILSGGVHKLHGDFVDDVYGPAGTVSLLYTPITQLGIEARVGLGKGRWLVTPSMLARYPDYYGANAQVGDYYPGTLTRIEGENEVRLTSYDLLLHYNLVTDIPAVPFIYAGVGLLDFSPATAEMHEALPNVAAELYSTSAVSIPLGAGVRIPFNEEVGIVFRGEYRLAFTEYLDDVSYNGEDDGITSVFVGLTYSFNPPPVAEEIEIVETIHTHEQFECCCEEIEHCEPCCHGMRHHHCGCCHCCCCGGGGGGSAPAPPAPAPAPPAEDKSETLKPPPAEPEPKAKPGPDKGDGGSPAPCGPAQGPERIKWELADTETLLGEPCLVRRVTENGEKISYIAKKGPDGKPTTKSLRVKSWDVKDCEECMKKLEQILKDARKKPAEQRS
jgi:hypothetical protein